MGEVVLPEEGFFERAFTTLDAAYSEVDIHRMYGWTLYYFWVVVLSAGLLSRLIFRIRSIYAREWLRIPTNSLDFGEIISPKTSSSSSLASLLKQYITAPATFNYRCAQPLGWCTIPPRIQTLTIVLFIFLNVVLCSISYRITPGNLYWPDKHIQLWRYVSDRTGILSLANFPMAWVFGMRNNTLMWMTGWGFGTYNNFHRWVGRVATVQAVVHSVGYTFMIYEHGGWALFEKYLGKHYFWNGELATIFMCALLAFSVYGLCRSHYEAFLTLHILFSIIVLLTTYYHVEIFNGEYNIFIYPCVAIWIFDRMLRAARILSFNPTFWSPKAIATFDADANVVRMEVECGKSLIGPRPGAYYYVYVLDDPLYAHQNHPFTLAYVSTDTAAAAAQMETMSTRSPLRRTNSNESNESDALLSPFCPDKPSSLVFLIRPYNGFTSRPMRKALLRPARLRVLIEGPFGHALPLHDFPNIVFVVGGTGIAVPLSYLSRLLSSSSIVRNARIVWAVREHAFLRSVLHDFGDMLGDERVSLEAHVTRDEEHKDEVLDGEMERVRVEAGRPDVHSAVEDAAREAERQGLAVVACGPAQMADQARRACVDMLARGYSGVDYFEESFTW